MVRERRSTTAFPAETTGMSNRRLGFTVSKSRGSNWGPGGPWASTFYGNLSHRQLIYTWGAYFQAVFTSIHQMDQIF